MLKYITHVLFCVYVRVYERERERERESENTVLATRPVKADRRFVYHSQVPFCLTHKMSSAGNNKIDERIAKGNKAYCANAKLIRSEFLKKNTKMNIYKTMIRPVVMY
jgi:hypothetical protein